MGKCISISGGCYNEAGNISELYRRCLAVLREFPEYDYEFVIADNCSTDGTRDELRSLAAEDKNFRVIMNSRNFGHIRSPFNAILQARGDAVVVMCTDLQDPPEVIRQFIQQWQAGYKVAIGVREGTRANRLIELGRRGYYALLALSADGEVIPRFTGFGLYDRCFLDAMRRYQEPYPYLRGLVSEIGFRRAEIGYVQECRKHGKTKNNYFTLYDIAMTGFVNHTKLPLRLAVFVGMCLGGTSFFSALVYLIYKLLYWNSFQVGMAPLVIGLFFFSSVQLFFIGILGEYLGAIWTQVKNRPLAIEEERINFE